MATYILRRIITLIPVLLIVGVIVFGIVHFTPGDPAAVMAGQSATPEQIEGIRKTLGLDRPLSEQFIEWFWGIVRLDFGESIFLGMSVTDAIRERAQPTLLLTFYALLVQTSIGIPAGVIAAVKRNSFVDRLLMILSISGAAIPTFFLGILLILFFSVRLRWLPSGGYVPLTEDPVQHLKSMIMPAFALGFSSAALLARMVRSTMLEVLREDYVRTAFAKGIANRQVVIRHALRNALIPVITVVGASMGALLGGAVVTELVFTIPGMGRLVVQSIARRDFPVIQGAVMIIAGIYVLVNLLVDILYVYVDPRVRYGSK
jgi:peptide/nickel transport system permease protein